MRIVALVLVVWFTTAPLAEAYAFGETPEPCPMAASMPDDAPCFTAPCPCDHSSQAVAVSQAAPTTLPRAHVCVTPLDSPRRCQARPAAAPAAGFPFAIDRPPGRHV